MKKTSSRSQRGSRGIKGKHILQICVLLGVCIWLIYQVKYSHDKKKEFFDKDSKKSTPLLTESEAGLVKLGRKDLLPGYHNPISKHVEDEDDDEISHEDEEEKNSKIKVENENHEEEDDEVVEEDDEEEKNKQGEEVVEEDEEENKHEEDEIDEQDQSKTGRDPDKDDEEKETVDETHEENYKADDASSAVSSHETRVLNTEKLKETFGNSTDKAQENDPNVVTNDVKTQEEPSLKLREAESGNFVNKTATEVKDGDSESSKIAVTESRNETVNGNVTEAVLEASGYLQNETEIMRERSQEHDKAEDGAPPSGTSNLQAVFKVKKINDESDPNITVSTNITSKDSIQDESRNLTSESSLVENISGSNTTEVKENSTGEKQSSNLFTTEQTEEADDTSETKILQEEREALADPETLPDIRTEGNEEDEEAMAAE